MLFCGPHFPNFTLSVYWKNETNTEEQAFVILRTGLSSVSNHAKQIKSLIQKQFLYSNTPWWGGDGGAW